jgi:transposase InsO family protein
VLCRHGLNRLDRFDRQTGREIRRYEHPHPGSLVHVDVKKLGRIPKGGGWRAHGRSEVVRGRGIGYDYVHAAIDDHSRIAYAEILNDETGPTCASFALRAALFFLSHGIPVREVLTDNARNYTVSHDFKAALGAIGARHLTIRPHCPWQNGKVERFNRTIQVEWAYRQVFTTNTERAQALDPWLDHYNTQRRHSALGGLPPISRLS